MQGYFAILESPLRGCNIAMEGGYFGLRKRPLGFPVCFHEETRHSIGKGEKGVHKR